MRPPRIIGEFMLKDPPLTNDCRLVFGYQEDRGRISKIITSNIAVLARTIFRIMDHLEDSYRGINSSG